MRNIERFIEEQALELACKLDEVDVVKWHEWAKTAYHRPDQRRVFKEYYGEQQGDEAVYRTVKRAVQATGITVKVCPQARGVLGSQDPDTRTIELAPRVQTGLRIGLLIHEWTHAILHSHINDLVWMFYYKEREPPTTRQVAISWAQAYKTSSGPQHRYWKLL